MAGKNTALSAAAAKKAEAAKLKEAEKKATEELDSFDDEEETEAKPEVSDEEEAEAPGNAAPPPAEPEEPEVRTRKDAIRTRKDGNAARARPEIKPTDAFVRDRNGNIRIDEDGDKMLLDIGFHERFGFVSRKDVLFPNGFQWKKNDKVYGHVMNGVVVLKKCPRCGHRQSVDEALEGRCGNEKAGPEKEPCHFNLIEELSQYTLKDFA